MNFAWKSEVLMDNKIGEGEKDEMTSAEQGKGGTDWFGQWGPKKEENSFSKDRSDEA